MIRLESVTRHFIKNGNVITALDRIDLQLKQDEMMVIKGPSGSGKSTLLFSIAGMLRPDQGDIHIREENIYALNNKMRTAFRARHIGFIFQMYYLIPYLNLLDNVLMAPETDKVPGRREKALALLTELGLEERIYHKPAELSAGEKQRTAMARAFLHRPGIILADEPTANLDSENAMLIRQYLKDYHAAGNTVILVSHDREAEALADRLMHMKKGSIMPVD